MSLPSTGCFRSVRRETPLPVASGPAGACSDVHRHGSAPGFGLTFPGGEFLGKSLGCSSAVSPPRVPDQSREDRHQSWGKDCYHQPAHRYCGCCPFQRGAIHRCHGTSASAWPVRRACSCRLWSALRGHRALESALHIEAAETVANEEETQGHRFMRESAAIVLASLHASFFRSLLGSFLASNARDQGESSQLSAA